jgi:hypothetical protein
LQLNAFAKQLKRRGPTLIGHLPEGRRVQREPLLPTSQKGGLKAGAATGRGGERHVCMLVRLLLTLLDLV